MNKTIKPRNLTGKRNPMRLWFSDHDEHEPPFVYMDMWGNLSGHISPSQAKQIGNWLLRFANWAETK